MVSPRSWAPQFVECWMVSSRLLFFPRFSASCLPTVSCVVECSKKKRILHNWAEMNEREISQRKQKEAKLRLTLGSSWKASFTLLIFNINSIQLSTLNPLHSRWRLFWCLKCELWAVWAREFWGEGKNISNFTHKTKVRLEFSTNFQLSHHPQPDRSLLSWKGRKKSHFRLIIAFSHFLFTYCLFRLFLVFPTFIRLHGTWSFSFVSFPLVSRVECVEFSSRGGFVTFLQQI